MLKINAIPNEDPILLKKQFYSLLGLVKSLEEQRDYYRDHYSEQKESYINDLKQQLESEKEMNNILTNELNK